MLVGGGEITFQPAPLLCAKVYLHQCKVNFRLKSYRTKCIAQKLFNFVINLTNAVASGKLSSVWCLLKM